MPVFRIRRMGGDIPALKDEKGTTYQWLARGLGSQVFALTSLLDLTLVFPLLFTNSKVERTTPHSA